MATQPTPDVSFSKRNTVSESAQSAKEGYTGIDLPGTKQAKDVDASIGHRYAVSGNTTTPFTGIDEAYRTYAGVGGQPL